MEINNLLLPEEVHWKQRLRAVWPKAEDKNTKFFHQKVN